QAADTPRPDLPLLRQGYRGFVNWTFLGGTLDGAGVTTAHGYQIDGHMWAGLGIGLLLTYDDDDVLYGCGDDLNDDLVVLLPIFATFRYDFGLRKISPFAEASLGGAAGDARGLMAASLAGVRFNRFNIAIGWTGLPSCRVYAYDYVSLPKNQFTFRLGVDFGWHNW
ncbi:hypothetical protein NP234_24840, partial [Salmonella enterica]|nr:hypothetical protein [Salmonella enterica]